VLFKAAVVEINMNTETNTNTSTNAKTVELPTFEQVDEVLAQANAYLEPSELHGLLCGSACHGGLGPDQDWMDVLLAETPSEIFEQVELFVRQIFSVSVQQLASTDFDFQLLLLDDEKCELLAQLAGLGNWCEGFLLGMELGQRNARKKYNDEVKEALEDIAQASRIYLKAVNSKELLDESALLDCAEHVRVAVMLIYAELNGKESRVKH